MAYVPTTGLAGKVAKRKASALAGPEMTQKEVMAENPNISANARLQQSGIGGAMKEGTKVLDNSPKGRIAGNPTGKERNGTPLPVNNGQNGGLGASIATPDISSTQGSSPLATSGLQSPSPVKTPSTPANALGAQGGLTSSSPTIGGTTPASPGLQPKPTVPGQDYVLGLDELDETQRTVYDSLSPIEKKAFEAIAKNDYAAKADYLEKANSRIESAKKMEDMKVQSTALNNEQAAENSKIQIQQAREKIDGMKRRISYLGSRGQPGVSQAGIENVNQEVTRAEGILDKMYKSDSRLQQGQQIGVNYEAEAFSRQLKEITDDLDQKVGKEFQSAYNTYTKAVLDGKFDTPEDVENFREQLYASLDAQIVGATDANLQQMQFLVERGDKLAEDMTKRQESEAKSKAEQEKMTNTVNKDMSEALGYYVNGLGDPIINTQGNPILIPDDPIYSDFDANSGNFITVSRDNEGNLSYDVQQVMNPASAYKVSAARGGTGAGGGTGLRAQALGLVQGLGGSAGERNTLADNIVNTAQSQGISLLEAKKQLGYKTGDDTEFADTRKSEYKDLKKDTRDKTSQAKTTLKLLDQEATAVSDVAAVVGFLKTIDPSSVARESEVESVENARGTIQGIATKIEKMKSGKKLSNEQRTQLKSAIKTIVDASDAKYDSATAEMITEFEQRGLDPTVYIPTSEVSRLKSKATAPVSGGSARGL